MRWILLFLAFTISDPALMIAQLPTSIPHPETYVCYQVAGVLIIDGNLDESDWAAVPWTDPFVDIEGHRKPAPFYQTRVKMLWDSSYFYFAAELLEEHLWATLRQRDTVIFYDNDFEIFIDPDGDTHGYYELEMNAFNTVWDLLLPKPYREGGPAIDHWDINGLQTAVKLYGSINDPSDLDEKWTVEVAIPWDVLEEYAPHAGSPQDEEQWRVNFSRVQYDLELINGRYSRKRDRTGNYLPEYNWVWSPQWVINMHRPETWGYVQFTTNRTDQGEIPFRVDGDFGLRMAMYQVYFAQEEYLKLHGHLADRLVDLPKDVVSQLPPGARMYVLRDRFVLEVDSALYHYSIDEEGKLLKK